MRMKKVVLSLIVPVQLLLSYSAKAEDAKPEESKPEFDVGFSFGASTDYMDYGVTKSDHHPSPGFTISPTYGIFYGKIAGAKVDFGTSDPKWEGKYAIGATPTFGKWAVDFYLERKDYVRTENLDRWMPYVTGTYTFDDKLSASLGVGYFAYDSSTTTDFWELYTATTYTPNSKLKLLLETTHDFDFNSSGDEYQEFVGTVTSPIFDKFEISAKIGGEIYTGKTADYAWYELIGKYNFDDHFSVSVGYHGNTISSGGCSTVAYTDCDNSLFAKVSYNVKLSDLFGRKK